jgi:branched-chain amino acid aminotransferase
MLEERIVYLDGDFVAWDEARVHLMCHSLGRGSAIFEVLSFHNTERGTAVFRLDEHIDRLFRTAGLLDMDLSLSKEAFHGSVLETVRRNNLKQGLIKIICYFSQIAFDIFPPEKTLNASIFAVDPSQDLKGMRFPVETGTTAYISKWRKLDPETVPVEAKAAAHYLNGMMAKKEARKLGFETAVLLDTQGFIAEGGTESIFLVKDGRLLTPSLGTVLQGISRKSVLDLSGVLGIESMQGRLAPDLFFTADEIFFSGTPNKVLPVRQINSRVLDRVPGPITRKLFDTMERIVAGHDDRFKAWLFPVSKEGHESTR